LAHESKIMLSDLLKAFLHLFFFKSTQFCTFNYCLNMDEILYNLFANLNFLFYLTDLEIKRCQKRLSDKKVSEQNLYETHFCQVFSLKNDLDTNFCLSFFFLLQFLCDQTWLFEWCRHLENGFCSMSQY
jgi:hypothetical protein